MDIPARDRAHHDRLMTWATGVFGRQDSDTIADFAADITERAATLARSNADGEDKLRAVLAEIGFWCVIDSMCEQIRLAE